MRLRINFGAPVTLLPVTLLPVTLLPVTLLMVTLMMATASVGQEKQVSEPGRPKLVVLHAEHDFGEVKSGTALKHTFTIKNEGNSDLVVQNVAPA